MIAIPPAPNAEGYRRGLMAKFLVGSNISPLRQYMLLPKTVSETKVLLMGLIETHPHLKDADPRQVVENLKNMAVTYFHSTGQHLDLRIDVPKEMMLLSSEPDADSVSSRHSRVKEEQFESADDEELSEAALKQEEKELEEMEKRHYKQKELRKKKAELDARRHRLQDGWKEPEDKKESE
jgi:hypothetical protein